jgi:uncharacterized protein (TIGR03437 family)
MVAVLLAAPSLEAQSSQSTLAPSYSTASIANAATNLPSGFAPNTIISIYGSNLAYASGGVAAHSGYLPTSFGGVTVFVGSFPAYLFYVSPGQINVLIPYNLSPGPTSITVLRDGAVGPTVPITLTAAAPGIFQTGPATILATHSNGDLIRSASPAVAGEVIVVYAVGLGKTNPDQSDGAIPSRPAVLANFANLAVLLNGSALGPSNIQYAGITPGCAGLYQVNVLLPNPLPPNPEVRLQIGPNESPAGLNLPTQ